MKYLVNFPEGIEKYHIYDYMGAEPFEHKIGSKKESMEIFHSFLRELPSRINELKKIIPADIELDYTFESLQKLDAWVYNITDFYRDNVLPGLQEKIFATRRHVKSLEERGLKYEESGAINEYIHRVALDPFMRSVANDLGIYFSECLRRIFMPDLIWMEGHYKRKQGGGHPRVSSPRFKESGHSLWYVGTESWIPTLELVTRMESKTIYYSSEKDSQREIGFIAQLFKRMIGSLSSWDAEVPEEFLFPKF